MADEPGHCTLKAAVHNANGHEAKVYFSSDDGSFYFCCDCGNCGPRYSQFSPADRQAREHLQDHPTQGED